MPHSIPFFIARRCQIAIITTKTAIFVPWVFLVFLLFFIFFFRFNFFPSSTFCAILVHFLFSLLLVLYYIGCRCRCCRRRSRHFANVRWTHTITWPKHSQNISSTSDSYTMPPLIERYSCISLVVVFYLRVASQMYLFSNFFELSYFVCTKFAFVLFFSLHFRLIVCLPLSRLCHIQLKPFRTLFFMYGNENNA